MSVSRASRMTRLLGLATVPMALALFGCNASISIGGPDYAALERDIATELDTAYAGIDRTVDSVTCPRLADDPKAGDTFLCTADVDGSTVRVEVVVDDDEGGVRFSTLDLLFDLPETASGLSTDVSAQVGFPVTVDCGQGLKVVAVGSTFTCTALDNNGGTATVEMTARPDGESSWQLVDR
ncbi:DUF4333 domain-containing protein [Nocardia rhizosphaerae]|uniref:DUF4333 domain-containing protein n=1 Tax=Nocardia rhizosphaerae TaxID=1691571 RepID=A0ABV8L734_9NOCA